jgi:hypothetical protein
MVSAIYLVTETCAAGKRGRWVHRRRLKSRRSSESKNSGHCRLYLPRTCIPANAHASHVSRCPEREEVPFQAAANESFLSWMKLWL